MIQTALHDYTPLPECNVATIECMPPATAIFPFSVIRSCQEGRHQRQVVYDSADQS